MAALLLVGCGQAVLSPVETPDEAPERALRESERSRSDSAPAENTRNPARDTAATEEANGGVDSILTQTAVNAASDDMEASPTIDTTAATDRSSGHAIDSIEAGLLATADGTRAGVGALDADALPPEAGDCGFRGKPITDSGRNRSLIPIQTDHRFRSKPITFSRG